ncbi:MULTISPECIES: 50S ribosomal protein L24 [unclassified Olsenella]|uniref:50S ribosomal protein L24 n=2 Tax=Olsenella TaxID=133925 RepID=UPI000231F033|nr:50S ribosomal protein L24 [Olsenella sp. oral taxon 809 str. F0356]KXB61761.1 ribosomal protein L24 [Olsenella sp. DNF00959]
MAKMKIKKGDQVEVLSGKDKGKRGEVIKAMPAEGKVVVRGVAMVKKAQRPTQQGQQGGIVEREAAIDVSNVAIVDPQTDKPTRVGYRFNEDGKKVRFAKKSGVEL